MATPEEIAAKVAAEQVEQANAAQATANAKLVKAAEDQAAKDKLAADAANAKKSVIIVGRSGGAFNIDGEGFGNSGTLTIGGRQITLTAWQDTRVKGQLPVDVRGAVVLQTESGIVRHGVYPTPAKS